jgi:hypothetical protein
MKIFIASGWFCGGKTKFYEASRRRWLSDIQKTFGIGVEVCIVNNASPVDYPLHLIKEVDLHVEFTSINQNAGHAQNLRNGNSICGWHASVLLSLTKFLLSDADLYVYIEQDVVLENLTEEDFYTKELILGRSLTLTQPIQQSIFAVNKTYARKFLSRLLELKADDYTLSCERKFAIAGSTFYRFIPSFLFHPLHKCDSLPCRLFNILQSLVLRLLFDKEILDIPGGRDRKYLGERFYLQQLTNKEMHRYYHEYL